MAVTRRTMAGGSETYDVMGTKLSTEQLVCAVSGFYFSLYLVSKLFGGKKKDEAPGARRARDGRARDGRGARHAPVADALTRARPSFAARALSRAAASVSMGMGSSSIPSIIDEGASRSGRARRVARQVGEEPRDLLQVSGSTRDAKRPRRARAGAAAPRRRRQGGAAPRRITVVARRPARAPRLRRENSTSPCDGALRWPTLAMVRRGRVVDLAATGESAPPVGAVEVRASRSRCPPSRRSDAARTRARRSGPRRASRPRRPRRGRRARIASWSARRARRRARRSTAARRRAGGSPDLALAAAASRASSSSRCASHAPLHRDRALHRDREPPADAPPGTRRSTSWLLDRVARRARSAAARPCERERDRRRARIARARSDPRARGARGGGGAPPTTRGGGVRRRER